MKKLGFVLAATALLAASCAKEIAPTVEITSDKGYEYVFRVNSADSRTTLDGTDVKWEKNDRFGVFAEGTVNKYGSITTLSPVTFPVYLNAALTAGSKVYCYHPYSESNNSSTASAVKFVIPTSQTGDFDAMPQVALPFEFDEDKAAGTQNTQDLYFCNLGSVVRFLVYSTSAIYRAETVKSIAFTSATDGIAGNFTFDVTAVDYENKSTLDIVGCEEKTVTLTADTVVGSDAENAGISNMVITPGTFYGTIVLTTDVAEYTYTLSESNKIAFARNGIKRIGLNLASANVVRSPLTKGNFNWDLTKASYESASASSVVWSSSVLTMTAAKAKASTDANSYLPADKSTSRFYKNSTLTFGYSGINIEKVVFTAASNDYATTLAGSSWTNASATVSGSVVTVVPTDGGGVTFQQL